MTLLTNHWLVTPLKFGDIYNFAGELQTIYRTLVVRMWDSRQFEQKELWRNTAEFVTTTEKTVGLVMERIIFRGERLDAPAVWRVRDEYFPARSSPEESSQ